MLYIFDLDGTLVDKYGTQPLTNVADHLALLADHGHSLAVATNQAGLAWRIMTHNEKFPDVSSMAHRFTQIVHNLPQLHSVPWFVSLHDVRVKLNPRRYDKLASDLVVACDTLNLQVAVDPYWRKPEPGMLLAAQKHYGFNPEEIAFIGDFKTDAEAAATAGIRFYWAGEFFNTDFT